MTWWVYMLQCRDGTLYTGTAADVEKRYALHVAGKGARYTRARPPEKLLACWPYPDRSTAVKAECLVKKMSRTDKRRLATGEIPPPQVATTPAPGSL